MSLTEEQLEAAVEEITEAINDCDGMNPDKATQEQSIEFLDGVIDHCHALKQSIRHDMEMGIEP